MRTSTLPVNHSRSTRDRTTPRKPKKERRQSRRFPLALPVRYNIGSLCGWGQTLNIGSGGALFSIDQPVSPGDLIELCIGWPVLLDEKVHLNLVADGVIVYLRDGRAAVKFERCAFRTSSSEFRRQAIGPESGKSKSA